MFSFIQIKDKIISTIKETIIISPIIFPPHIKKAPHPDAIVTSIINSIFLDQEFL